MLRTENYISIQNTASYIEVILTCSNQKYSDIGITLSSINSNIQTFIYGMDSALP